MLWFPLLPQKCVPKVTPAVPELAGSSSAASGSVGDRPLTAMALLLPQATSCFSFLFVRWLFSPVPGAGLSCQQLITRPISDFTSPTLTPAASATLPWFPVRRGRHGGKGVFLHVQCTDFCYKPFFCLNNVDKLSAQCWYHSGGQCLRPIDIPLPPQTEICMQHTEGHNNNNGCIPQSQFSKHREWMKSPSVALYPAALIPWITSSETGSAGHVRESSPLLSATLPRLQEEKLLKLKKRVVATAKSLWGVLMSGKDSLVWNSLGLLISRACHKKHSSSHTSDDSDIFRKRICAGL